MSFDNQQSVVRVRGRDFPIREVPVGGDATLKVMQGVLLSLYAMEDPKVDAVLRQFKIAYTWPNGKKEYLYPENEKSCL